MPINYLQVEKSLDTYCQSEDKLQAELKTSLDRLWAQFSDPGLSSSRVREHVERAEAALRTLYCAKPSDEPLLFHKAAPHVPDAYTLVAADGSQIAPSRHRPLQFCLINVGMIKAKHGSGEPPLIETRSELIDHQSLYTSDGALIGEDAVSLFRDLRERTALLDFCMQEPSPVLTLTDGPLNIYQGLLNLEQRAEVDQQIAVLNRQFREREIISVGFIDKPGSEMISRMLALLEVPAENLANYDDRKREHRGVSDRALLKHLLREPGERSAVFEAITLNEQSRSQSQQVMFFYLNISQTREPYLVRVEFPAWIAEREDLVDLVHAVVYADSCVLENHPYPYLLHRAHELAVVSYLEADQIENMLLQRLEAAGLLTGLRSNKEANKQLLKR